MNPGQLNHRIKFSLETATQNASGGSSVSYTPVVCSDTVPTDVTWGDLQPISSRYKELAVELGATVFNTSKMLRIRYRKNFTPTKAMIFEDLNYPGDIYIIHSILPYYPGTKSTFQNNQQTVYKDNVWVYIIGIKRT